ncbi:hypothetical protein DCD75_18500, partial [Acinetobacter baumannii]
AVAREVGRAQFDSVIVNVRRTAQAAKLNHIGAFNRRHVVNATRAAQAVVIAPTLNEVSRIAARRRVPAFEVVLKRVDACAQCQAVVARSGERNA